MDLLLSKVTQQAMNYAIRSGVAITASYAMRQSSRLLKSVPKSNERDELLALQETLRNKIRIISPAIDMIELITARGNTSLESAVSLTKSLRFDIQALGQRLAKAAEEGGGRTATTTNAKLQNEAEIRLIIQEIRKMIARLEDAIPSISLAIATSGAKLSTDFPSTVSPTRFAQASNFLSNGDLQYSMTPNQAVQIGPTFTLSVYMLFAGNIRPEDEEGIRETTWKEVMHKARVKLRRVPMDLAFGNVNRSDSDSPGSEAAEGNDHMPAGSQVNEFAYQLMVVEDLDDERVHDFDEEEAQPGPLDEVELAGIREYVPIHQVSKIFYADTGKVLNIGSEGEANSPVLLLKRDVNAIPPRRMMDKENEHELFDESPHDNQTASNGHSSDGMPEDQPVRQPWSLPPGLDPEWMAFEVYTEPPEDSEEDEESQLDRRSENTEQPSQSASPDPQVTSSLSNLHLKNDTSQNSSPKPNPVASSLLAQTSSNSLLTTQPAPWAHLIRTSLSLLEVLLRLASLQQFQQQSHLSVTDELLNFFLDESATTGAGGDEGYRQRLRANARRRVGWDPYDESPIKRRGEEYQYRNAGDGEYAYSPRWDANEREREEYFLRSREHTPASPSPSGFENRNRSAGGFRSPLAPRAQTRSMTGLSSSPATSSINTPPSLPAKHKTKSSKGRPAFLNQQTRATEEEKRRGSPLRPQTGVTDEGLGTSPGSSLAGRLDGGGGERAEGRE